MGIGNVDSALLAAYQYANKAQKSSAAATNSVDFLSAISARAAQKTAEVSFKEMLKSKYSNAYYNVMDTSMIDRTAWGRTDYPMDAYFKEPADESVLSWKPSGPQPDMQSAEVQAVNRATFGKIAVVIPPALEEKMKNNPKLAEQVMEKVDNFIAENYRVGETRRFGGATYTSLNQGFIITFDENGEINHSCITGESFSVSDSSFAEARKEREARNEEYERFAEEKAERRRQLAKLQYHRQVMSEALQKSSLAMAVNLHLIDVDAHFGSQPQMSAAYETAVGRYGGSAFGNMW